MVELLETFNAHANRISESVSGTRKHWKNVQETVGEVDHGFVERVIEVLSSPSQPLHSVSLADMLEYALVLNVLPRDYLQCRIAS